MGRSKYMILIHEMELVQWKADNVMGKKMLLVKNVVGKKILLVKKVVGKKMLWVNKCCG